MKYVVLAYKWFDDVREVRQYVAGVFPDFVNARVFADAYSKHFSATAEIIRAEDLDIEKVVCQEA